MKSWIAIAGVVGFVVCAQAQQSAREAWEAQVPKNFRDHPAFAFVEDNPAFPRVLLIGDSISIKYTIPVREGLASKANVHRIPENGAHTHKGLTEIDRWLGDGKWDVIHFNWGLHDVKRYVDDKLDASGERVSTPDVYAENLERLVKRLKKTGATLIWAATTPIPEGASGRRAGDAALYNEIAAKIMIKHGVAVNDLHAHIAPKLDALQRKANVHFTDEGSRYLGERVVSGIEKALR